MPPPPLSEKCSLNANVHSLAAGLCKNEQVCEVSQSCRVSARREIKASVRAREYEMCSSGQKPRLCGPFASDIRMD